MCMIHMSCYHVGSWSYSRLTLKSLSTYPLKLFPATGVLIYHCSHNAVINFCFSLRRRTFVTRTFELNIFKSRVLVAAVLFANSYTTLHGAPGAAHGASIFI